MHLPSLLFLSLLSHALETLAGPKTQPSLLHNNGSFILPLKRVNQHAFAIQNKDFRIFNLTLAKAQIHGLLRKYQRASKILHGIGTNHEPDFGKYFPAGSESTETVLGELRDSSQPVNGAGPSTAPGPIRPILAASGTAQVPLTDYIDSGYDILYQASLNIGTPPQVFTVDVDTGSADLWVPSDDCTNCGDHKKYNPSASSTKVDKGSRYDVAYGSGNVSAALTQDVVSIQGLSYEKQFFGRVDSESFEFQAFPNDGLLGMAFSSIAMSGRPTFFENLIEEKVVSQPYFSLYLTRSQSDGSELCLGCINLAKTIGPIVYVPVVSMTYWTLNLEGMNVDNAFAAALNNTKAAIDSGTTFIYAPSELVARFYSLISGSRLATEFGTNFYAYPCDLKFTASIVFGGERFSIDLADFNLGRLSSSSSECIGGVISVSLDGDLDANLAIIGDEFLKSWVAVFDYSNGARVGFAPSINNRA